jgi:hypothetical protein
VNSSGPIHPPLAVVDEPTAAELAGALLAAREGGIRRLCFVGLSERGGVHLLVAAHEQGLASHVSRSPRGQMTVVLEASASPLAVRAPSDPAPNGLVARCRRLLQRVAGHR